MWLTGGLISISLRTGRHRLRFLFSHFNPLKPSGQYMYHQVYHSAILHSAHTLCLCVLCGSQNKQPLFPYTTLTDWFFIIETECVYCAVRTGSLKTVMVNLCFGPVSNPSKSVWIFHQKSVTRTGFSSSIYVPSCQYIPFHSTETPHSFSSTCCSYQKNRWAKPGNLPKRSAIPEIMVEKYIPRL